MSVNWQRSTFCTSGTCVEVAWVKSSASLNNGTCVEVAEDDEMILVRDSKRLQQEPLKFSRDEWAAFLTGVKLGEFDFGKG